MTNPRRLPAPLTVYRIGDARGKHKVYSSEGAFRDDGGRWHTRGDRVIYAAEHFSTAMLEKLVHWSGSPPNNQRYVEISIPAGTSYEEVLGNRLPGWDDASLTVARQYGHGWYGQQRSAILLVPSVVARPERNVIINDQHAEFPQITCGSEITMKWDERLFR